MDDFEIELKRGFLDEASQLLAETEQCFLSLETSPNDVSILEKIFRLAHNLKGSAKAVGFDELGEFTHLFETYLLKLKSGAIAVSASSVSLLLRCNDHLGTFVSGLKADLGASFDSRVLMTELSARIDGQDFKQEEVIVEEAVVAEISNEPLSHNDFVPDPSSAPRAMENRNTQGEESIRVSLARLDKLLNFVGEMVILQTVLREQSANGNAASVRKTADQLGKVTKEVQDLSMSLRMVPLKQTFNKMQRIVRDTSNALGKKVHLRLLGEETEVDKTILENLSDPLVHLVRNSVDHAIEMPGDRINKGKSETGEVTLNAFHQSGSLVIEIKDDGTGLDPVKLRSIAVSKGIISPTAAISDKDAYQLIFAPGFSTKSEVTDISGRGVGMDVVKTNIQALQGNVHIETELGKGTCFRIVLPLTLAIIDGMIIQSGSERYIIPLTHVHESLQPAESDIHHVTGLGEVLALRGENIPLYRLDRLLTKATKVDGKNAKDQIAVVVRTKEQAFAILVDDILGQYQVVIKKLGEEHRGLRGFSGSAILGDGRPSLILELPDLVKGFKPLLRKAM